MYHELQALEKAGQKTYLALFLHSKKNPITSNIHVLLLNNQLISNVIILSRIEKNSKKPYLSVTQIKNNDDGKIESCLRQPSTTSRIVDNKKNELYLIVIIFTNEFIIIKHQNRTGADPNTAPPSSFFDNAV